MYFLLFLFLICSLGVFVTAYFSIDSIKLIAKKFYLSETFIGTSFLAIGTSFPEFVNSIVSGFHDKNNKTPHYAFYSFFNITGSNIWQIVFLAIVLGFITFYFCFKGEKKFCEKINSTFWEQNILSWKIVVLETILLLFIFAFPKFFSAFNFNSFNLLNIPFFCVWVWYLYKTYVEKKTVVSLENDKKTIFDSFNKYLLLIFSCFLLVLFGAFSYGNFYICTLFEQKMNVPGNIALGVILSFITSMPEFCVFYFLFRKREYLIAVSGLFGSSLFNLTLPLYTNLISLNPLFGYSSKNNQNNQVITTLSSGTTNNNAENNLVHLENRIVGWLLLNLVLSIFFLFIFISSTKIGRTLALLNSLIILLIYIAATFFISVYL